jgi:hypothetical protein
MIVQTFLELPAMYERILRHESQTRRFTITSTSGSGWDVVDEEDGAARKDVRYLDWHRVERARRAFAREAAELRSRGWTEVRALS